MNCCSLRYPTRTVTIPGRGSPRSRTRSRPCRPRWSTCSPGSWSWWGAGTWRRRWWRHRWRSETPRPSPARHSGCSAHGERRRDTFRGRWFKASSAHLSDMHRWGLTRIYAVLFSSKISQVRYENMGEWVNSHHFHVILRHLFCSDFITWTWKYFVPLKHSCSPKIIYVYIFISVMIRCVFQFFARQNKSTSSLINTGQRETNINNNTQ